MSRDTKLPQDSPLARWSRLKREAEREKQNDKSGLAPASASSPEALRSEPPTGAPRGDELPPVESLTFDSDFAPYFQSKVDAALKRQALKQLLRDPRFNVMDGLDVYIDDYTQADPIPPEIVRQMVQGRYIFDPPPTRINAQGHVEDVPPEELAALREAKAATETEALAPGDAMPAIPDAVSEPEFAGSAPASAEDEVPLPAIPAEVPAANDDPAR